MIETPFGPPVPEIHLEGAPLELVIAQVRFPPVVSIGDGGAFIGPFQEALRPRYPNLRPERELNLMIGAAGPMPAVGGTVHWFEQDKDDWRVGLTKDFVALSTTRYTNRDDFMARFEEVLQALDRWLQPHQTTRLGVRYVSRIKDQSLLDRLPALLRPEVLGPTVIKTGDESVSTVHTLTDIEHRAADGWALHARWGMVPRNAMYDPAVPPATERSFILDIDVYSAEPAPFVASQVMDDARDFSIRQYRYFRWATTDDYLRTYGAKP